jgi:hypothetical protein
MAEIDRGHRDVTRYERSDAPPALIGTIAAGLAAAIVAVSLVVFVVFPGVIGERPKQPDVVPPAPRLQHDESGDLAALRRVEDGQLETYGWIDRERGIVRIPIEEAMRIVAQRGVPDWPKAGR